MPMRYEAAMIPFGRKMNGSRKKVFCLASTLVRNKNKVYSKRALVSARLLGGTKYTQCRIFLFLAKNQQKSFRNPPTEHWGKKVVEKVMNSRCGASLLRAGFQRNKSSVRRKLFAEWIKKEILLYLGI